MNRKVIIYIILGASLSLIGLVGLQLYWIKNAILIRESNFKQSVNEALSNVVYKYSKIETAKRVEEQMKRFKKGQQLLRKIDSLSTYFNNQLKNSKESFPQDSLYINSGDYYEMIGKNNSSDLIINIDTSKSKSENKKQIIISDKEGDVEVKIEEYYNWIDQSGVITDVMRNILSINYKMGVDQQLNHLLIDSLIEYELKIKGISTKYEFGVYDPIYKRFLFQKTGIYNDKLLQNGLAYNFYGIDVFRNPQYLIVYFPNEKRFLLTQIGGMLSVSAFLIIVLIFLFTYIINAIIKQKKLSEMKNDFINNMTHEFKTPISTVSLACEALTDKDLPKNEDLYNTYIKIINDENKRLGTMAEKILQTAILDKGELKLKKELHNLHSIIDDVAQNFNIQVEKREGELSLNLTAENQSFEFDKTHITNVIYNLLDNAIKYTHNNPSIVVSTEDREEGIVISVADNGIGISKANQKKIFEKLYRVPTGNIHDVKGFGLGLSYVKAIVEHHGGSVSVESELKKGTTFRIFLPIVKILN